MGRLEEMNADEFQNYLSYAIKNYANEHVKAGNWKEAEAIDQAEAEFKRLLPDGKETANHHLFSIRDEEREVGMIWLAQLSNEEGYIYDINIWKGNQGRGYGKEAMKEIEIFAQNQGLNYIGLHVFGHNKSARDLYEKLGYIETDIMMRKKIKYDKNSL